MDPILFEGRRRRPEPIGGLFAEVEASARDDVKKPRAPKRASPQSAVARQVAAPTAESKKAQIREAIRDARYRGITRLEIHDVTGILRDTVNGRVRELLDASESGVVERGERGGEGVLYIFSFAPTR